MANAYQRPYGTNPYDTADTHGAGAWNTYHSPRAIIPHGMGVGNRDTWYDRFSNSKLGRVVEGAAANAPVLAGAAGKARSALGKLIPAKGPGGAVPVPKPRAAAPKAAPSVEPPTESLIQGRGELPSERSALQRQALNPMQPLPPSPIPVNSPPPVVRDITPGALSVIPRGPKPAMIPAPPQPGATIGSTGAKLRPHFTDPIETPSSPNTLIIPPKNVPATFPRGPGVSDARGTIPPHYTNQVPPLAVDSAMMGPVGLAAAGGAGAAALTAYIAKQKQSQPMMAGESQVDGVPGEQIAAWQRMLKPNDEPAAPQRSGLIPVPNVPLGERPGDGLIPIPNAVPPQPGERNMQFNSSAPDLSVDSPGMTHVKNSIYKDAEGRYYSQPDYRKPRLVPRLGGGTPSVGVNGPPAPPTANSEYLRASNEVRGRTGLGFLNPAGYDQYGNRKPSSSADIEAMRRRSLGLPASPVAQSVVEPSEPQPSAVGASQYSDSPSWILPQTPKSIDEYVNSPYGKLEMQRSGMPGALRGIAEMQKRHDSGGYRTPQSEIDAQAEANRRRGIQLAGGVAPQPGLSASLGMTAGTAEDALDSQRRRGFAGFSAAAPAPNAYTGSFRNIGGQYAYTPAMSRGEGPAPVDTTLPAPDPLRSAIARVNMRAKHPLAEVTTRPDGTTVVDSTKSWGPAALAEAKAASGQLPLSKQQLLRNRVAAMQRQADKEQWQSENLANYRFNRAEQKAMPQADAADPYEQTLRARAAMGDSNAMQAYAQMQASKAAQQQHADQIEVEREKNATDLYGKNLQGWQGEREAYDRSKQAQAWDMESMARKQQSLQAQLADPALQADPGKRLKLQNALDDVNNKFEQYEAMKYPTSPRPEYTPPVPPGRRGESTRRPILSRAEFQRRKAEQLAQQQAVQPPPPAAPVSPPVDEKEQLVPGTPTESTVNAFLQKEMEDKIGSGKMDRDQFVAYMKMHPQISKYGPDVVDKWVDSQRRSQRMTDQKKAAMLAAMNPLATPVTAAMSSLSDKFNLPEGFDAVKDYLSELFGGDPRPAQRMRAFGRSAAQ